MLSELRRYPGALMLSVFFHVGILIVIFVNIDFNDSKKPVKQGDLVKTVKAAVIDQQQLEASKAIKQAEIDKKKKAEQAEKKRKAEADRKKREEAKRKADEKKKKLAEDKRKREEAKRKATEKEKAEALKKKRLDEKKKMVEKQKKLAEVKHRQTEQKRKAEAKRKAEKKRLQEEKEKAEIKRKAEEKKKIEERKKAEAEQRRLAEEEQKRKQDELKAQLEAEETQRRLSSLRDAYRIAIKQKIERNWRRPQESGKMPDCEVGVLQGPGGIILDVTFGSCKGGTATYRASIENAVYKAEPLPKPGDPALFERELIILFNPR